MRPNHDLSTISATPVRDSMTQRFALRTANDIPTVLITGVVFVLSLGCASWKESEAPGSMNLSNTTILSESKKTAILEIEFVHLALDPHDVDQSDSIWQWVDETGIDADTRIRLLENGIRAGLVANDERFQRKLESGRIRSDVLDEFLTQASIASDVNRGSKRVPMRFGRRYELPLRQPIDGGQVVLARLNGETVGQTLRQAQCLFAVTTSKSNSPNQIELRLRPEIQHGDTKTQWITSDSALRIDARRETWSLSELDLDVTVRPGDMLVVGPRSPPSGLAKLMLTGKGSDQEDLQMFLLIKVAQVPEAGGS